MADVWVLTAQDVNAMAPNVRVYGTREQAVEALRVEFVPEFVMPTMELDGAYVDVETFIARTMLRFFNIEAHHVPEVNAPDQFTLVLDAESIREHFTADPDDRRRTLGERHACRGLDRRRNNRVGR